MSELHDRDSTMISQLYLDMKCSSKDQVMFWKTTATYLCRFVRCPKPNGKMEDPTRPSIV